MPYNPQQQYRGDEYAAQGKSNLMQAVLLLVGGLTEHARQAKELRSTLADVDPQNADRYKKMGLAELRGAVNAMEMEQKRTAATLLAQEAKQRLQVGQQTLQRGQSEAAGQTALQTALSQARPPVTTQTMSPTAPGGGVPGPFGVNVPMQGQPSGGALVSAIMQNPEAVNTPAGQSILGDWMRSQGVMRGAPQAATVGNVPVIYQPYSGQFDIDPAYKAKQQAEARKASQRMPGDKPIEAGGYFWTGTEWRQKTPKKALMPGLDGGNDVIYDWKGGKLMRSGAADE